MELCKLCKVNTADKTNTHYLTDGVIRKCLNEMGSNVREKGMAFNISQSSKFIEPRFQRKTSQKSLQKTYGRAVTEEEIEAAKQPMWAVDHVFCSECEKKFTAIETSFLQNVLPSLRSTDFTGQTEISFNDPSMREFFLLQQFRTSACHPGNDREPAIYEQLRLHYNNPESDKNQLKSIPLQVTYLNTLGGDYEFTKNMVGVGNDFNNRLIFMNDFIIQTSSDGLPIHSFSLLGLEDNQVLTEFTNYNETDFRMRILDNNTAINYPEIFEVFSTQLLQARIKQILKAALTGKSKYGAQPQNPRLLPGHLLKVIEIAGLTAELPSLFKSFALFMELSMYPLKLEKTVIGSN